jgi:hypothetical protein
MSRSEFAFAQLKSASLICFAGMFMVYPLWIINAGTAAMIGDAICVVVVLGFGINYMVQAFRDTARNVDKD